MKKTIYILVAMAALVTVACNKTKKTESGLTYTIHEHGQGEANSDTTSLIHANYRIAIESTDSVLMETFTTNKPGYIPVFEPTLREALTQFVAGDSADILINADTFFIKSFGQSRPPFVKAGDNIKFTIKVKEIFSQKQMEEREKAEASEMSKKDSVDRDAFLATLPDVKQTKEGVYYSVMKDSKGKQVKKGDKVKVFYKGTLLNGQVFDEEQTNGFEVSVGLGQVIPGWESVLLDMKEGQRVKSVIPWQMAYGPRGSGPIPPMSTLVFEMEIVKIN